MTNLYPTNRKNPCPVCENTTGNCRTHVEEELVLCMTYVDTKKFDVIDGFKCLGQTKDGTWAKFKPIELDTYQQNQQHDPERVNRQAREKAERLAQEKIELEYQFNQALTPELRHKEYSKLLDELELHPIDKADLLARGFTKAQIEQLGFKSVEKYQKLTGKYHTRLPGVNRYNQVVASDSGYLIPVRNYDGLIVGLQLRLRNPVDTGRYRWVNSPDDGTILKLAIPAKGFEPALENPLAIFKPENPDSIWIVEGTGVKPFLTSQRLNALVIGAAGGQFLASQNQFEAAIKRAIADYGQLPIRIALDAGDIDNSAVRNRWVEVSRFLQQLQYDFEFAWWNQITKNDCDIDELEDLTKIEFISFEEFLNLKGTKPIFKSPQAFNEKAYKEWELASKFTSNIKLNQKHFKITNSIPKSGKIVAGKAFMGSGKTHSQLVTIKANNETDSIYSYIVSPRRKLNKQTIKRAQNIGLTIYNLKEDSGIELLPGLETNLILCPESFWKLDGYFQGMDVWLDEVESMLPQILSGGTIKGRDQALTFEVLKKAVQSCNNLYLLDANLSDKTVKFFAELAKDKKVVKIDNLYKPERPKPVIIIDCVNTNEEVSVHDKSALVSLILQEHKPFIGTDSQTFAQTLSYLLREEGKAGFVLDSISNEQSWLDLFVVQPELKKYQELLNAKNISLLSYWADLLLEDPNSFFTVFNPDYFIYTTTAESGVSIDLEGFFSCKVLVFFGVIATNNQLQMSGRLRDDSIPTYVYCPERSVIPRSGDFNQQRVEFLTKAVSEAYTALEDDLDATASTVFNFALSRCQNVDEFWSFGTRLKALENFEKSNLRACLSYKLEQMGYKIEIERASSIASIKDELKVKKEMVLSTEAVEIFDSKEYESLEDAEKAKNKSDSIKVKRAVKKTKIIFSNPGIEETNIWSANYIYECYVKDRNWRYNLDKFYLLFNPEISAKKANADRYFKLTSQFVNRNQIIKDLELNLKGLRTLGIDDLIKSLEKGLELHKDSVEVTKIVNLARAKKLLGFRPMPETVDKKENIGFIRVCLSKVGVKLKSTGRAIGEDGVRRQFYSLDFDDFNSEYRQVTLQCIGKYFDTWLAEKYDQSAIDWEYSKAHKGERLPNPKDEEQILNNWKPSEPEIIVRSAMANVETQQVVKTVIESSPAIEPKQTIVDQAQEILMATFSPMLRAIAKQIKETGSAAARALEGLSVIELLAIDEIVQELLGA
jgi:hypothetical protein